MNESLLEIVERKNPEEVEESTLEKTGYATDFSF
jgi:hypothetical protein